MFIGIDNGLHGGIAVLDEHMQPLSNPTYANPLTLFDSDYAQYVWKMPILVNGKSKVYDINKIIKIFEYLKNRAYLNKTTLNVVLEKCHTMPRNGARQNFTNGEQYGIIKTVLIMLKIPFEIVSAKQWQKVIFQGQTIRDTKQSSIQYCTNKFPGIDWRGSVRSSKSHDGKTDAMCMAVYAHRIHNNKK